MTQTPIQKNLTKCQLVRYIKAAFIKNPNIDQRTQKTFLAYFDKLLQKEDDAVQFEAAKTMCELFEIYGSVIQVEAPFSVLSILASQSAKPVNKYAALRVMNRIALK